MLQTLGRGAKGLPLARHSDRHSIQAWRRERRGKTKDPPRSAARIDASIGGNAQDGRAQREEPTVSAATASVNS